MQKNRVASWLSASLGPLLVFTMLRAQPAPVPSAPPAGDTKIAFLADTIAQVGWDRPNGFLHLIDSAFKDQNLTVGIIKAGVGANVSADLLGRLPKDVLNQKPDWMALSCGGNDALRNIPVDKFRDNVTSILDQTTGAGIKVIVLTAPMLGEDPANPANQKLAAYNDVLRELARPKNFPLIDLNAEMQAEIARVQTKLHLAKPGNLLTIDGTHLNGLGEEMVAAGILQALGFTPAQLAQERDLWLDQPGGMDLPVHGAVSTRQFLQLRDLAASEGISVDEMLNRALSKDVQFMLADPGAAKQAATKKK